MSIAATTATTTFAPAQTCYLCGKPCTGDWTSEFIHDAGKDGRGSYEPVCTDHIDWQECQRCGGSGGWSSDHPLYGRLSCPEPGYSETECYICDGTGLDRIVNIPAR